jgi:predicted  nucleic acid-binding Zn-ribbon protein
LAPSVERPPASPSLPLLAAVHRLAASQLGGDDGGADDRDALIEAIARLSAAPPDDHWNRGLLGGLRSQDPEIVDRSARAVVERLARFAAPADQDRLIATVLDSCFLNLSGRPRLPSDDEGRRRETRRSDAFERAAAQLIRELARLLAERPLELEHHRSRLLARARSIAHLAGRGDLAEAVVAFEHQLGEGDRADQRVAAELFDLRKFDLYTSPLTTEPTLLAHLARDHQLPVAQASQELFQVYRMLVAGQTKERARRALLAALGNLAHWLEQLPQHPEEKEVVLQDVLRARAGVPWEELDARVCRHLEAHLELVPGPDHPEDLLALLQQRYDAAESEDILIQGIEVLRRLPLLRRRSQEISAFVLRHGRRRRSAAVWRAMLDWVGSYLTGLSDFILTREALGRDEQRRIRALRTLLADDRILRDLLHRLASDEALEISRDPEVAREVREQAWRVLFRSLPPERRDLLEEGLLGHGGRLFYATLEEAAASRQRELWNVVLGHWEALFEGGRPAEERRRRIEALATAFGRTRNFDAVQDGGEDTTGTEDRLGPLVRLALDDDDPLVRQRVEEAVVAAGYALELDRERQRREILRLRDDLTTTNARIVELEERIARLVREATDTQLDRADCGLAIQAGLQERDLVVTDGWLTTTAIQVDLEEVRAALLVALAEAAEQLHLLHDLRHRMQREHRTAQEIHGAIQTLVRQQEQQEAEIDRLEEQAARAEGQLESARGERSRLQSRLAGMSPPSRSSLSGDPERDRQAEASYRNAVARYESEVRDLQSRIHGLGGDIERCQRTIASCREGIRRAHSTLERLSREIREQQARIAAVRQRIAGLEREFRAVQRTCEAIRREIARLQGEVRRIEAEAEAQRRAQQARLADNRAQVEALQQRLDGIETQLHELSRDLNQTGDQRDRQVTRSQRLVQGIDSGRDNYERIAGKAERASAQADAEGFSAQQAAEQAVREGQELLVHYSHGVDRAVGRQPRPITRDERRRQRMTTRSNRR